MGAESSFHLGRGAILLLAVRMCAAPQSSDFDGTWVLRLNGQNIFKLSLSTERGVVTGSPTNAKEPNIPQHRAGTTTGPVPGTLPRQKSRSRTRQLELTLDDDPLAMTPEGRNR